MAVPGYVTAVFGDCYYVQAPDRCRGIKVIGDPHHVHEGDYVTISGDMTTRSGERCIQASEH